MAEQRKSSPGERFGGAGPGRPKGTGKPKKSRQLLDMDHVYRTEKAGDDGKLQDFPGDTPGQRTMRALLRENPKEFLALMQKYRDHYDKKVAECQRKQVQVDGPAAEPDAKARELISLMDELLSKFEESSSE